jgi:hypothetical protein
LSADRAHLKKSDPIINRTGVVSIKDIIAVHGIIVFDHGKIPGKKSYNINKTIGKLNIADILNFFRRYLVSFFLFIVSSGFCFSS